jgi:hypothetical protein
MVGAPGDALFGAQGWISTNPDEGVEMKSWVADDAPVQVQTDRLANLVYACMPGMMLVGVEARDDVERAANFLRSRMRAPVDEGAIVLSEGLRLDQPLDVRRVKELANVGIVVLRAPVSDLEESLAILAEHFKVQGRQALAHINAFMDDADTLANP